MGNKPKSARALVAKMLYKCMGTTLVERVGPISRDKAFLLGRPLNGPMGPHGAPWGPVGTHGAPWGPMGPRGGARGPVGPLGPQVHCDGSAQKMNPPQKITLFGKMAPRGPPLGPKRDARVLLAQGAHPRETAGYPRKCVASLSLWLDHMW